MVKNYGRAQMGCSDFCFVSKWSTWSTLFSPPARSQKSNATCHFMVHMVHMVHQVARLHRLIANGPHGPQTFGLMTA